MQRRGRTLPVLTAAAALALVVGACGGEDRSPYFGTTIRKKDPRTFYSETFGAEPEYLDPGKLSDTASQTLALQLFEGLTKYDPRDSHPTLGVATRWEQSDDSRFFRFHLRADAKWSDGKPVTAKDFEYAWRRVLRPSVASRAAPTIYAIKNAELYNRGLLLTAKRDLVVRAAADASSAEVGRLVKGAAVRVVARSPLELSTDLPLFAAPAAAKVPRPQEGRRAHRRRARADRLRLASARATLERGEARRHRKDHGGRRPPPKAPRSIATASRSAGCKSGRRRKGLDACLSCTKPFVASRCKIRAVALVAKSRVACLTYDAA